MAKLTKLQLETLVLIRDRKVSQHKFGYAAWRIIGANPSVVGRLVSLGLARWTKVIGGDAELTDEGHAATPRESGTEEAIPGEHQEVLDAIQSYNSGEDE